MQAVILSFDSLAANSLGCYGNEWIETPHLDRLASCGTVFDRHFADTIGVQAGAAWATGRHANSLASLCAPKSIGTRLTSNGIESKLIATTALQDWHRTAEFNQSQILEIHEGPDVLPDDVPVAHLVKAGIAAWQENAFSATPRLLWLHAPSPGTPPQGFESLYFEDFEERGQHLEELPDEVRARHPAVYAGSVSLIDHWIGELLKGIDAENQARPTLIIVTASRGYLWHLIDPATASEIPNARTRLSDQNIRTPLVLNITGDNRFEDFKSLRSDRLVQSCDLLPTLLDWFGIPKCADDASLAGQSWLREMTEEVPARSSLLISDGESGDAVRTTDWLCIRDRALGSETGTSMSDHSRQVTLFTKPEDVWDVNDIASQQPEILTEMLSHFTAVT